MKAEKIKKEKNWALPGVNITLDEFVAGIHKAEEGPFYTLDEVQILRKELRYSE